MGRLLNCFLSFFSFLFFSGKATKDAGDGDNAVVGSEQETLDGARSNEPFSANDGNLLNKLRAVKLEIYAVTSAVEELENLNRDEDNLSDSDVKTEHGNTSVERNGLQALPKDVSLQHAITTERLRSLIETRDQLQKDIIDSSKNSQNEQLIKDLIKDEPKPKRRLKQVEKTNKNQKKRLKKVALGDDDQFDAVLNAASAGFVETVCNIFPKCTKILSNLMFFVNCNNRFSIFYFTEKG